MLEDYIVGIRAAICEYPIIGDDIKRALSHSKKEDPYKECLYLLLDVYKQYEKGKIGYKTVLWALKELCNILNY